MGLAAQRSALRTACAGYGKQVRWVVKENLTSNGQSLVLANDEPVYRKAVLGM